MKMSDFEAVGPVLFWKTLAVDKSSSPVFRVQDSLWNLLLERYRCGSSGITVLRLFLMQQKLLSIKPPVSFAVTCLLKTPESRVYELFSPGSPLNFGYKTQLLEKHISSKELRFKYVKFVIIFEDENGIGLPVKDFTEDEAKQAITSDLDRLSADFGELLESGKASDVQLKTKDGIRSAHKSVLAARSEVFSAMFRSDMKESATGQVDISDVDGDVMDLFLRYLYTGRIPDTFSDSSTLPGLYTAGDKYEVSSLKKLCRDRMTVHVIEDNYQELLLFADAHSDADFKDKVIEFILKNPGWLKAEKWFKFSEKHLALANYVYRKCFNEMCFRETLSGT